MSSVIILSSPPKTFARSPTPVDSSSPLPSTEAIFAGRLSQNTPRKFKTVNVQRDGFGGLSSAGTLLGTNIGAENLYIGSPLVTSSGLKYLSSKRFKSSVTVAKIGDLGRFCENENEDPIHDETAYCAQTASKKLSVPARSLRRFNSAPSASFSNDSLTSQPRNGFEAVRKAPRSIEMAADPFELPSSPPDAEKNVLQSRNGDIPRSRQTLCPLNREMAIPRRTDWTPTKDTAEDLRDDSPSANLSRSFSAGLMGTFSYNGDSAIVIPASRHEIDTAPTKRRRLDMIENNAPKIATNVPPPKTAVVKRPKAPPKKSLTITGLATSNYFGQDKGDNEPTALDQYLSTQARDLETSHVDIASEVTKVKAAKKQRVFKKVPQKSTLVSPASAIKALENQDALFGSASQLARDESPSLMRDTLEAIRQSESNVFSSPLRTQDTEPISIESTTPRATTGISRFAKTRGLWAAAGRDEDNALLHVDAIDIDSFDTPDLRRAFPGKDVLVQPSAGCARASKSPQKISPSLRGGDSSHRFCDNLWDIDDMETPVASTRVTTLPKIQVRTLHTTAGLGSPRKRAPMPPLDGVEPPVNAAAAPPAKITKKRTPKKPAFAGLATDKLQKQIATYGFKPMKKREQMIAVLEKCWDQKHAHVAVAPITQPEAEPSIEEIDDSLKHGDYLSNVHGLATRPIPKEKKVPKPRKPKEPKEVKPRKKRESKAAKEEDDSTAAPKVVRKRKSKALLSDEKVVDVDDLEPVDGDILTEEAAMALADAAIAKAAARRAAPMVKVKAKAIARTTAKTTAKSKGKVTTPTKAKRARSAAHTSPPAFASAVPLIAEAPTDTIPSSPSSSPLSSIPISTQISLAITSYTPPPGTNHQATPTWHEKILLYDPIVLEDLALWLNTVGLGAIGEDREVSALEVRAWCEERGVCCLWRGGWRGNKVENVEGKGGE
jgi:hypothetical protein